MQTLSKWLFRLPIPPSSLANRKRDRGGGYASIPRDEKAWTTLFTAYGALMEEYVAVPDSLLNHTKELQKYLALSYEYAKTLKPKPTKKKS